MPHAVLRVVNMHGVIVKDFYLSFPDELKYRIMAMIMSSGLQPTAVDANHVKFEEYGQGVEIHALFNWIENSGYRLSHMSESAVSQYSSFGTYVFVKSRNPMMGNGGFAPAANSLMRPNPISNEGSPIRQVASIGSNEGQEQGSTIR